jgi:hypothetical protein
MPMFLVKYSYSKEYKKGTLYTLIYFMINSK